MKSLKVTLTLWLALFFIGVLLVLAVGMAVLEFRHTTQSLSVNMKQIVRVVSDVVREKEEGIFNYLTRVARKMPSDPKEAERYIREINLSYLPVESTFYLLDARGRITRAFRGSFQGFKGISLYNLEDVRSAIITHRPTMSRVHISPFTGERVVSMNFPAPRRWILRADISTDLFLGLLKNVQKAAGFRLLIFNRRGDVFEHPNQEFPGDMAVMGLATDKWGEIKKAAGKFLHFHLNGVEMVGVFMPLKPFDLIVGTVAPASYIKQNIVRSIFMFVWMGLGALSILALVNLLMILYFVIRPIEEISSRVSQYEIGKEDAVLPLSLGRGFSELSLLVERFNRMSFRIHTHVREIARLESMIRNILDSSPAIVVALDPDGRIWYMNKSGEDFFHISSDDVIGKRLQDLDPGLESYEEKVKDVMDTSRPYFIRAQDWLQGRLVDGTIYPLVSDGMEGVVVQWLDVSERHRAREAYRRRLEEIFSQMDDMIYVVNEDYRIEIVNERMAKGFQEDWMGKPCYTVVRELNEICPDCHFPEIKKGKVIRERMRGHLNGRYYDALSIPLFNEDGSVSKLTVKRDVTEYVAIHEALKASEATFRSLFEGAPVGMSVHQDGKFVMVNEALAHMLGYQPGELIGASIMKIVHPDDREFVSQRVRTLYSEGKLAPVARERYLKRDGSSIEILVTGIPTSYRGRPAVHVVVVDQTEQIRLQTSLLRSEAFSAQILEKALDPILILSPGALTILEANLPATHFFGLSREELVGKTYFEFVDDEELGQVRKTMEIIEQRGSVSVSGRHLKLPAGRRIVDLGAVRVKTPEGEDRDVVYIKDLTEFVTLQQRLAQAQKQESLWQMAGGFAHDFNNLLAIMFGYLDMMEVTHDESKRGEYVKKLREISVRARDLVQNILLFSRENRGQMRDRTVKEVIRAALNLVQPALGSKIDLKVDVQNPSDVVRVDTSQMVQVILNLALNARDAIGEENTGVVSIQASRRVLDEREAKILGATAGRYVEITVADTGPGIPEWIQGRIFDPFFTTKTKGAQKGTGLGLAIVQSIAKNFAGFVDFQTSPRGTVFRVLIPLRKVKEVPGEHGKRETLIPGEGMILVVEDERTLQIILKEMLEELGYKVKLAGNGREAIEKVEKGIPGLRLVLMDLAMPEMGGEETLEHMMKIHPEVRVVIMSGLVEREKRIKLLEKGAVAFMKKPITITRLSQVVHEAIQSQ